MIATLLALGSSVMGLAAERIIIDTDCGFFGDDGTAIVMLANSPSTFTIEAVTIVSGNVWAGSSHGHTLDILRLVGRPKIPIFRGADMPLRHTPAMAEEAHKKWGPLEFRGAFGEKKPIMEDPLHRPQPANELIRRLNASPGEITIVALGPLTNIARMLARQPHVASKIKRLVFMGGQYRVAGNASKEAEFNFWFDPEAAQAVLRSTIREKVMFGLDVTNKVMLDKAGFDAIIKPDTPIARRFKEDFGVRYPGFLKNPKATVSLWDALVPAWMLDPSMFGAPESIYLDVDTNFGPAYGKVIALDRKLAPAATPVRMINDVDAKRVLKLFHDLLCTR